jgi:hypothetical protein
LKSKVVYPALRGHIRRYFKGHRRYEYGCPDSATTELLPRFRVVRVAPGPKTQMTVYLSLGACEAPGGSQDGSEFLITTSQPEIDAVGILAVAARHHHARPIGLGDTLPLGGELLWAPAPVHLLVTLPYPFGPELEVCCLGDGGHVRFRWLLPITDAEKRYLDEYGLEALEQAFETAKLNFLSPVRTSVV